MNNFKSNFLFKLEKRPSSEFIFYPDKNKTLSIDLKPTDKMYENEQFILDINRASIQIKKVTFQKRVEQSIVLRRLDFYGGHRNPELGFIPDNIDKKILSLMNKYNGVKFNKVTHLHFYIDGYNAKWAFPLEEFDIIKNDDMLIKIQEFCKYCNIIDIKFQGRDLLYDA